MKNQFEIGQEIETTIVQIAADTIFIDLGLKSEGFVSKAEFADDEGNVSVREGDKITLDINNYKIHLEVSDEELARRKAEWKAPAPKVSTGYLARYAKLVSSADKGAILQ
mgnify:CR=1 FL=1